MFDLRYLDSINVKYTISDHMAICNYDILSKRGSDADKYRSRIIDINTGETLSFSFNRFYNYGEFYAAKIDHNNCSIYEKLDGTLIVFFHNGVNWDFHTRSVIGATGPIAFNSTITFRDRILNLLNISGFSDVNSFCSYLKLDSNQCMACEYTGPYNRVVTPYSFEQLYLLRVTDRKTEVTLPTLNNWPFNFPKTYALNTKIDFDTVLKDVNALGNLEEGFVVVDRYDQRVKIKSATYLSIFHAVGAGKRPTLRNFCRMVLEGDIEEIISYFPEYSSILNKINKILLDISNEAEVLYASNLHLDLKQFALKVRTHPLQGWLFSRYKRFYFDDAVIWTKAHIPDHKLEEWVLKQEPNLLV